MFFPDTTYPDNVSKIKLDTVIQYCQEAIASDLPEETKAIIAALLKNIHDYLQKAEQEKQALSKFNDEQFERAANWVAQKVHVPTSARPHSDSMFAKTTDIINNFKAAFIVYLKQRAKNGEENIEISVDYAEVTPGFDSVIAKAGVTLQGFYSLSIRTDGSVRCTSGKYGMPEEVAPIISTI